VGAAVTNTVTTLDPGTMVTTDMSLLIVDPMAILEMGRSIRAITARVLLTLAVGAAEPAAWVIRPVGVARAPEMITTMLVLETTRPERKAPLDLGHAVLPAPVCWTTQTRTKTAS